MKDAQQYFRNMRPDPSGNGNGNGNFTQNEEAYVQRILENMLLTRSSQIQQLLDKRRDMNKECGYPETHEISPTLLKLMYDREAIATRVVEVLPNECWQVLPKVYEDEDNETVTPFEEVWDGLGGQLMGQSWYQSEEFSPVWEYLRRIDILSGIGFYGVLLLGIDDGLDLREPVDGVEEALIKQAQGKIEKVEQSKDKDKEDRLKVTRNFAPKDAKKKSEDEDEKLEDLDKDKDTPDKEGKAQQKEEAEEGKANPDKRPVGKRRLLYMRPFDETLVQISRYENDPKHPRYGRPVEYSLAFVDPTEQHAGEGVQISNKNVHWTRCLHIADNLGSSDIFGIPRQRPVWNRLLDLRKLYGGGAEGYWNSALPILNFVTHPQLGGDVELDTTEVRSQFRNLMQGLQRYFAATGGQLQAVSGNLVDPTPQITNQIQAICVQLGCPSRIFMGSERGELSSGQDESAWKGRLQARRSSYLIPRMIIPFVDLCIAIGVLPEPSQYSVEWSEQMNLKPAEKIDIAVKKTQALSQYVSGGVDNLIEPHDYLVRVLDFEEDEADEILEAATERLEEGHPDAEGVIQAGRAPVDPPSEMEIKQQEAALKAMEQGGKVPGKGFPPKGGGGKPPFPPKGKKQPPQKGKKPPFVKNELKAEVDRVAREYNLTREEKVQLYNRVVENHKPGGKDHNQQDHAGDAAKDYPLTGDVPPGLTFEEHQAAADKAKAHLGRLKEEKKRLQEMSSASIREEQGYRRTKAGSLRKINQEIARQEKFRAAQEEFAAKAKSKGS